MDTKTDFGKVNDIAIPNSGFSNYIYLISRTPEDLLEQLNSLKGEKTVVSAYGINSRHYMLVHVDQKIKRIKRNKKE